LPLASFLKRFAAPDLVFIFGMTAPVLRHSAGRSLRETLWPGLLLSFAMPTRECRHRDTAAAIQS
jgi:hypothetical protein